MGNAGSQREGICTFASGNFFDVEASRALAHFENREERLLRDVDFADSLHAAFAFFLFLQQLALARDVTAVALGQNVLAHGGHSLAGDDLGSNRGLDGHFKHLPRTIISVAMAAALFMAPVGLAARSCILSNAPSQKAC